MPSPASTPPDPTGSALRDEAASWIVRRDRGLTPEEKREFQRWLDGDPRRAAALTRSEFAWGMLDRLPASVVPHEGETVPPPAARLRWHWPAAGLIAAAIAFAFLRAPQPTPPTLAPAGAPSISSPRTNAAQTALLPDGTTVRLNIGAELATRFTATERRVRLVRGEAYFIVTPDAARPFIVDAGGVNVRAVGTAFNVNLQTQAVDVIVTEGKVQVFSPADTAALETHAPAPTTSTAIATELLHPTPPPLVHAGQRAVVSRVAPAGVATVVVSELAPGEVARALAWRGEFVRLGGATLAELAVRFEHHTGRRLLFGDASLGELRVGGRFPADDLDGFVRVLEENYGIRSERNSDGAFVLHRAR